jgi:23S rRNA (cytosine1962-C5)-methyltransferase
VKPVRRESSVRLAPEVARRIRDGHPWIFSEALRGRSLANFKLGQIVEVLDGDGKFAAMALADPEGSPPLRVFSRSEGAILDRRAIHAALDRALALRREVLPDLGPLSCYRILSGDSEGLPAVTVESYAGYLVVCAYSPVCEAFQAELLAALRERLAPPAIYLQRRYLPALPGRPRAAPELVHGEAAPPETVVVEGRTRFVVDVSAPGGIGLYPDMRLGRVAVARLAGGRRVLNCFSYTGAFSVVAALHGAQSVVSVDAAARAHGRARRNFTENRIETEGNESYGFVTGDSFATLARFAERRQRFDLCILDPPTFASAAGGGSKGRPFTALKDYAELVSAALAVTEAGGYLCAASNAVKLPAEDLERAIGRGAALAGRELLILEHLGQPADYPTLPAFTEGAHLKIFIARAS